jgi:tetratricopeptide (TPR) repeat protein
MTRKFFLLLLFLTTLFHQANSQNIDSLKTLLPQTTGLKKADILFYLAKGSIANKKFDEAKEYGWSGFLLARELNDTASILKTGRVFATALRRSREYDSSISVYQSLLPLSTNSSDIVERDNIVSGLAMVYLYKGEYDKALKFNFESLRLSEHVHDTAGISISLNNIGLIYYKIKDFKKATSYYARSIDLKKRIGDRHDLHLGLINLGLAYQGDNDLINSEKYLREGLALCNDNCPAYVEINGFLGLGIVYATRKENATAIAFFQKSYTLAKAAEDIRLMLDNLERLSIIYLATNRFSDARNCLAESDSLAKLYPSFKLERTKVYRQLARLYDQSKDYKKVAHYQNKFIEVNDSLFTENFISNMLRVEAEFLAEESEAKLRAQNEVLLLKEDVIASHEKINLISAILTGVTTCLLFILWGNFKRKKKINALLDQRLQERSTEFNATHEGLLRTVRDRNTRMNQVASGIQQTLQMMQRLSITALKDISDPIARQYFDEMERTRHELADKIVFVIEDV